VLSKSRLRRVSGKSEPGTSWKIRSYCNVRLIERAYRAAAVEQLPRTSANASQAFSYELVAAFPPPLCLRFTISKQILRSRCVAISSRNTSSLLMASNSALYRTCSPSHTNTLLQYTQQRPTSSTSSRFVASTRLSHSFRGLLAQNSLELYLRRLHLCRMDERRNSRRVTRYSGLHKELMLRGSRRWKTC